MKTNYSNSGGLGRASEKPAGRYLVWNAIKASYLNQEGSLRQLARKSGVSFHTLAKRARREGWALQRRQFGDTMATALATTALETATEQGRELGLTAAEFVARSTTELGRWMDRIEGLAHEGKLTPESVAKLVNSWRTTIEAGRATFNLDSREPQTVVFGVHLLNECRPVPAPRTILDVPSETKPEPGGPE